MLGDASRGCCFALCISCHGVVGGSRQCSGKVGVGVVGGLRQYSGKVGVGSREHGFKKLARARDLDNDGFHGCRGTSQRDVEPGGHRRPDRRSVKSLSCAS